MAQAVDTDVFDVLREGTYETPYGTVYVEETDEGYKVVVEISREKLGKAAVLQMLRAVLGGATRQPKPV